MTSLQDISDVTGSLDGEFGQRNLTLVPTSDVPDFPGALSSIDFRSPAEPNGPAAITVAVMADAGLEVFDLVVAATQTAHPELAASTAISVGSVNELDAVRGAPVNLSTISFDGTMIGVLVSHQERRHTPEPGGAVPGGQPSGIGAPSAPRSSGPGDLTMLRDVVLDVTVELGRDSLTLAQLLNLTVGSVVELDRAAGSPVDIRVNGILFGRGEVVVVDDEYAVRIVEILESPGP